MISFYRKYFSFALAFCVGVLALSIPLLRDFHLESAMAATLVGCFWAGGKGAAKDGESGSELAAIVGILGHLYLFGLPLLVYALIIGCFSVDGLGFWILYPVPGVFFGYAVGRLFSRLDVAYSRALTGTVLLIVAIGGLLVEFFSFPQLYFFNHVWGWWPGPIYDETVQLGGNLLYFRFMTLLWILLLWYLPDFKSAKENRWVVLLALPALIFSYLNLAEFGIISPRAYLQQELGAQKATAHFNIYYDESYYSTDEIERIALEHEFYLDHLAQKLAIDKPDSADRIESYLYGHPWQKKKLVGAKFTSYVPVWLRQDQLHIAKQQLSGSLEHELVHVLAKSFGNRLLNASWSIGLIEGLAVALSPNESRTTTIDQIVVSEEPYPTAEEIRRALSFWGFYGGRSAVNYTTTGSFVKFLLENYPVSHFKEAYRSGDVAAAYETDLEELVGNWYRYLDTVRVDSLDERVASRLFRLPSLFEKECPHNLSPFADHLDQYLYYRAEKDTSRYLDHLDKAYALRPDDLLLKSEWSFRHLEAGFHEKISRRASIQDSSIDLQLLYADAYLLSEDVEAAERHLDIASKLLKIDSGEREELQIAFESRRDPFQWEAYVELRYRKIMPIEKFSKLNHRTKIRAIQQTMESGQWELLRQYAQWLLDSPPDLRYFNTYSSMIHMLVYLKEWELTRDWIDRIEALPLRERYQERLQRERQWLDYIKSFAGTYFE